MSDTETIKTTLLKEVQICETGIAQVNLSYSQLSIGRLNNGNAFIDVHDGDKQILFEITPDQCRHLMGLLNKVVDCDF